MQIRPSRTSFKSLLGVERRAWLTELGGKISALFSSRKVVHGDAAYWIGSQADAIYATPSSRVGSVGVLQTVTNRTDQLKMRGVTVETFSAGKYKSTGLPHMPLTDEQRAMIQANVDEIHADFKTAVLARGRQIPPEAMEGQDFTGKNAAAKGMVTGLVQNRSQAIDKLSKRTR